MVWSTAQWTSDLLIRGFYPIQCNFASFQIALVKVPTLPVFDHTLSRPCVCLPPPYISSVNMLFFPLDWIILIVMSKPTCNLFLEFFCRWFLYFASFIGHVEYLWSIPGSLFRHLFIIFRSFYSPVIITLWTRPNHWFWQLFLDIHHSLARSLLLRQPFKFSCRNRLLIWLLLDFVTNIIRRTGLNWKISTPLINIPGVLQRVVFSFFVYNIH